MRKTLLIMAVALLLIQCRKPAIEFPTAGPANIVSMTITVGPGGKTDISETGAITWSSGDKIYVGYDGKYVGYLTLQSSGGSATGTFSGDVTLPDGTTGEQTFGFFYLGNAKDYSTELEKGTSTTVDVDFSSQNIYNNSGKLENASKHNVGYGSANGTVKDGVVTDINVTLVSKVALARFSFTEAAGKGEYSGPLTLIGEHIYNKMTVNFNASDFSFNGTKGYISLAAGHGERYVMLVPAGTGSKTLNFVGGATGSTTLENGIEANKFYGRESAIEVPLVHGTVNFGKPNLNWSKYNLGATNGETKESWYGDYYAWGATETWYSSLSPLAWKSGYSSGYAWPTCPGNGGSSGYNASAISTWNADNLTDNTLNPEKDAVTAAWGDGWRMPTSAEWKELYDNNTFEWIAAGKTSTKVTSFTAVAAGYLVVKGGKNSIDLDASVYMFLPAAGHLQGTSLYNAGSLGRYWSSSLYTSHECAYSMRFDSSDVNPRGDNDRYRGFPVRPVCAAR